jgi:hypothetical protein
VSDTQSRAKGGPLVSWIDSIALIGPGLADWTSACATLRATHPFEPAPTVATLPPILPPAERRRTSLAVRIALAAGHQAVAESSFKAQEMGSVFTSSGGDGVTCHLICEALTQQDRRISPTHFHNSVHNAPSGYWGIAMQASSPSTSLCGHDASFAAGLLETMVQVATSGRAVILVAYDAPYPDPLRHCRPVADAFALALVLSPKPTANAGMRLSLALAGGVDDGADRAGGAGRDRGTGGDGGEPTRMTAAALEEMRLAIPSARALPLMQAIARREPGRVILEYLDAPDPTQPPSRLHITVSAP